MLVSVLFYLFIGGTELMMSEAYYDSKACALSPVLKTIMI